MCYGPEWIEKPIREGVSVGFVPKILNLGCGDMPLKDALNIDIRRNQYTDEVYDFSKRR